MLRSMMERSAELQEDSGKICTEEGKTVLDIEIRNGFRTEARRKALDEGVNNPAASTALGSLLVEIKKNGMAVIWRQ